MSPSQLHSAVMEQLSSYRPDWMLLRKLDSEWRRYVEGEGGIYYKWLALAVRVTHPRLILELGTYTGASALMMYPEISQGSRLVSVDLVNKRRFVPDEVASDPRVRFVIGDDLDLGIFRQDVPFGVDFLFIDTQHNYRQISSEWRIYRHLLADEAVVVLDDIRLNDVPIFWAAIESEKADLTDICHHSGFGLLLFRREEGKCSITDALKASSEVIAERRLNQKALLRRALYRVESRFFKKEVEH